MNVQELVDALDLLPHDAEVVVTRWDGKRQVSIENDVTHLLQSHEDHLIHICTNEISRQTLNRLNK